MAKQQEWLRTGATMMIISLISEQDRYGYEIINELKLRSDSFFLMQEGSLYPILHRLENAKLVESYEQDGNAGRKRRYYRITRKGLNYLENEQEQWNQFTKSVEQVIRPLNRFAHE